MNFLGNIEVITNPGGLITVNETLFIQVFSFLIFLFIINRIMFRPLKNAMNQREEYVDTLRQEIEKADAELRNITKLIQQGESALKKEAQEMREKLETAGKQRAAESLETTRREIADLRVRAEKQIGEQIETARKEIKSEFESVSQNIMEKILDRSLAS